MPSAALSSLSPMLSGDAQPTTRPADAREDYSTAEPTQSSADAIGKILSGDNPEAPAQVAQGEAPLATAPGTPNPTITSAPQPQPQRRGGLLGVIAGALVNHLKGAGEGLMLGGIPGAVAGAANPQMAQSAMNAQRQIARARVDFASAQAAHMVTQNAMDSFRLSHMPEDYQAQQAERAANAFVFAQHNNIPVRVIENSPTGHYADLMNQTSANGAMGASVVIPAGPKAVVLDLSGMGSSETVPPLVKKYYDLQNVSMSDQNWAAKSEDQRTQIARDAAQFIFSPVADHADGMRHDVAAARSVLATYKSVHTASGDLDSPQVQSNLKLLQGRIDELNLQHDEYDRRAAQHLTQAGNEKIREQGAIEAIKENARVNAEGRAQDRRDQAEQNKRYDSFSAKYVQPLTKADQTLSQFQAISDDAAAGKMTGAESVVGLFNAIGISATPLKGMGFRINNSTVEEHADALGAGSRLYRSLLRLKDGDVITPQQVADYGKLAAGARHDLYMSAVDEAQRQGLPVDFLPKGRGRQIDAGTARIYLDANSGNKDAARKAAQAAGWSF